MNRVALSFSLTQLLFVSTWTVYVLFLPQLAAQAGIDSQWVLFILMADQAIFAVTDLVVGIAADRVARKFGALARWMVGLTVVSCIAFLALPFAAPAGSPVLFLVVGGIWAITSSALRAPPLAMLGKYVQPPLVPAMAALLLLGLGIANGLGPYLTAALRKTDPRLPFIVSSLGLLAVVLTVLWAEKHLARVEPPVKVAPRPIESTVVLFYAAVALLALGFQVHSAMNAGLQYMRFAPPANLERLMPAFWIGFGVLLLPAQFATRHLGGLPVMAVGCGIGALAAVMTARAGALNELIAWQLIAGGAWGCMLISATAAAIAIGHTGREGAATGGLYALLATATVVRLAIVQGQWLNDPLLVWALGLLPAVLWGLAGLVLVVLAARGFLRPPDPLVRAA